MKLMSWNVNGLKPTHKNIELQYGSLENFFSSHGLDIICFQETKVNANEIPKSLKHVPGFESFWSISTAKKGYSGCTTYVRLDHAAHRAAEDAEMPGEADLKAEGRVMITEHRDFVLINVYAPNAGDSLQRPRLEFKMRWFDALRQKIAELAMKGRQVILVGDLNIPRSRADVSLELAWDGLYTHEEVALVNSLATDLVDVWRDLNPDATDTFTVWNERTNARAYNRGLRIDYALCSPALKSRTIDCQVKLDLPQKWSDHAPVILELSGVTDYANGPPPPCPQSSRAIPKHGLQALFQRKALASQTKTCVQGCNVEPASEAPKEASGKAEGPVWKALAPSHQTGTASGSVEELATKGGQSVAVDAKKRPASDKSFSRNSGCKQQKVTGFFQRK